MGAAFTSLGETFSFLETRWLAWLCSTSVPWQKPPERPTGWVGRDILNVAIQWNLSFKTNQKRCCKEEREERTCPWWSFHFYGNQCSYCRSRLRVSAMDNSNSHARVVHFSVARNGEEGGNCSERSLWSSLPPQKIKREKYAWDIKRGG